MTVATTAARADYIGSGTTGPFPYTFRILEAGDLVVTRRSAAGVETVLSSGVDYTLTGAGSYNGGSITLTAALAVGEALALRRVVDLTQEVDLPNLGGYFPEVVEGALDKMVMAIQQQDDAVDRSIKLPVSEAPTDDLTTLPPLAERASNVLGFDSLGRPVAVGSISGDADAAQVLADGTTVERDLSERFADTLNVRDFGAAGNGTTDDTAAMSAAITAAMSTGRMLVGRAGDTYKITADFVITSSLKLDLTGCRILQATDGQGFLHLRADNCRIRNVLVEYSGTRSFMVGTLKYRGFSQWQRMCAVWVESSKNDIRGVKSKNLNVTLVLRGPVVRNPAGAGYTGSDTDPTTAYFYTTLATENYVTDIQGSDQDFAITGHQQAQLEIGNYSALRITQVQNASGNVPTHAIYMVNPDGTTLCDSVIVRNGHCDTNRYGVAHKFLGFNNLNIGVLSSIDCTGGVLLDSCTAVSVQSIMVNQCEIRLDTAEAPVVEARYGAYIQGGSVRIDSLHVDGVNNLECGAAFINGAALADLEGVFLRSRNPVGASTVGVIRCENTSETRVGRITHVVLGSDTKESITAVDTAKVHCASIRSKNTTRLARGDGSSQIFLAFDPRHVDNFDRTTAFIGNVKISQVMPYVQTNLASTTTVYGTTTAGAHTYTQREFLTIRRGDEVTIYAKFLVNGAFGGTGDVRIGPLPYTVAGSGSSADAGSLVLSGANVTLAAGELLVATANDGEAFVRMQTMVGLTKTNLPHTAVGASARIEFILNYRTTDAL